MGVGLTLGRVSVTTWLWCLWPFSWCFWALWRTSWPPGGCLWARGWRCTSNEAGSPTPKFWPTSPPPSLSIQYPLCLSLFVHLTLSLSFSLYLSSTCLCHITWTLGCYRCLLKRIGSVVHWPQTLCVCTCLCAHEESSLLNKRNRYVDEAMA